MTKVEYEFGPDEKTGHDYDGMVCLVAHMERVGDGFRPLPQCKRCSICKKDIEYPYDSMCKGNK